MKLASLKKGRDGQLVVVSRDLTQAVAVNFATTLQVALDEWAIMAPKLQEIYEQLNRHKIKDAFEFNPQYAHSPLPRAYQWADGSAYLNHVALVRKARGAKMPENFWTDPLMYQGGSDSFLAPCEPICLADEKYGIDFEAEIAVITDEVPMGIDAEKAAKHIQLVMLVNDVSLRNLIPNELAKGFGFFQSKPSSSFSPVAVTPDELGAAWYDGKVHLPLHVKWNGQEFGAPNAGEGMNFNFPQLIAHAAKTRPLGAGTIIGSGTVSNENPAVGSCCIAEKRTREVLEFGQARTPFMAFGDEVCIEMLDDEGHSIFGAIQQKVMRYEGVSEK